METEKNPPITGKEGQPIELGLAAEWTKNYRDKHPGETISQFFGKEILERILAQDNCLGIRFYYAQDKRLGGWQRSMVSLSNFILKVLGNVSGEKHLIITGVIANGADQLTGHEPAPAPAPDPAPAGGAPVGEVLMGVTAPVKKFAVGEMSAPCPGSPGCPTNVLTGDND